LSAVLATALALWLLPDTSSVEPLTDDSAAVSMPMLPVAVADTAPVPCCTLASAWSAAPAPAMPGSAVAAAAVGSRRRR
jgi:hypothetical protein